MLSHEYQVAHRIVKPSFLKIKRQISSKSVLGAYVTYMYKCFYSEASSWGT